MNATRHDQRGSVLIIAVIAMLVLGILSFSFALLSRVEMTTGVNYKAQAQAEALAEAGPRARAGRGARRRPTSGCGFTPWTDPGNASSYGCGAGLAKLLFDGVGLGAGDYSAVIDNDCSPLVPVGDPGPELQRGVARPRHERDGGAHGLGDGGERAGTGPGAGDRRDRQPLEARLLELEPGQSARLLQRAREPEREPDRSCRRTRTSTRAARPRTTTSHGPSSGAPASTRRSTARPPATVRPARATATRIRAASGWSSRATAARRTATRAGRPYQGYFDCALTTPCPPPSAAGPVGRRASRRRTAASAAALRAEPQRPACARPPARRAWCSAARPRPTPATGRPATGVLVVRDARPAPWTTRAAATSRSRRATFYGTVVVEGNGQPGCGGAGRDLSAWHETAATDLDPSRTSTGIPWPTWSSIRSRPWPRAGADRQPARRRRRPAPTWAARPGPRSTASSIPAGNVEFNPISPGRRASWRFEIQTQGGADAATATTRPTAARPRRRASRSGSGNTVVLRPQVVHSSAWTMPPTRAAAAPAGRRSQTPRCGRCQRFTTSRSLTAPCV